MICLAFDTSTNWGRFALARDDEILCEFPRNVSGSYADTLLPVLDEMLAEAGLARSDVDAVAVTSGPGSFTGVRIGVATAKGLAYGLGAPLYAVSTLEAMAASSLLAHRDREWAVPAMDARRGEIFAAVYRRRGAWVETVAAPASRTPDAWWDQILRTVPRPDEAACAGSGAAMLLGEGEELRPELASLGETSRRPWSVSHPDTAKALAWVVAGGMAPWPPVSPFELSPSYLRVSDAEVKRGLDLTPSGGAGQPHALEDRRPGTAE